MPQVAGYNAHQGTDLPKTDAGSREIQREQAHTMPSFEIVDESCLSDAGEISISDGSFAKRPLVETAMPPPTGRRFARLQRPRAVSSREPRISIGPIPSRRMRRRIERLWSQSILSGEVTCGECAAGHRDIAGELVEPHRSPRRSAPTKSIFMMTVVDHVSPWLMPRSALATSTHRQVGAHISRNGTGAAITQPTMSTSLRPILSARVPAR